MTIQKNYKFGGLNLRKSDLLIDPTYATNTLNGDLNYSGELRKRNGFDLDATMPNGKSIIYLVEYRKSNELVAMANDGLYKKVGNSFVKIPMSITGSIPIWNGDVTTVEINGTLYVSDTLGENFVFKYDGLTFTQAGVYATDPTKDVVPKTGPLVPTLSVNGQNFGNDMAYIPGLTPTDLGQLLILDVGKIYQFTDTEYGYSTVESTLNEADTFIQGGFREWNIKSISASEDGSLVVKSLLRASIVGGFLQYDLYLVSCTRTTNTVYTEVSRILVKSNFNFQFLDSIRVNLSQDGQMVSIASSGRVDGEVYNYRQTATSPGVWTALANITSPLVNIRFGRGMDLKKSGAFYYMTVGAPQDNPANFKGTLRVYRTNGVTDWALTATIPCPDSASADSFYFSNENTIILTPGNANGELCIFTGWRVFATTALNRMYLHFLNVAGAVGISSYFDTKQGSLGSKVAAYSTITGYSNYLAIGSQDSKTTKGPNTRGKVEVYNWTYQGSTNIDWMESLESPDPSYDNQNGSSTPTWSGEGFGYDLMMIPRDSNSRPRIAISYPGFNVLNVDGRGKVFTYRGFSITPAYEIDKQTSSSKTTYTRYFSTYIDINGNIINSEANTTTFGGDKLKLAIRSSFQTAYNDRYFIDDQVTKIGRTFNTVPLLTINTKSHNVVAGDKVLVKTYSYNSFNESETRPHDFQLVTIDSVTANSVTIRTSELVKNRYVANMITWNGSSITYPINGSNQYVNLFVSPDEFFNYQLLDSEHAQELVTHEVEYYYVAIEKINILDNPDIFLLDIYDDTIVKKEIPKIRYLSAAQGLMLGANITYPDEHPKEEFKNRFIYSDVSIGGSVETFAPFDYETIGENANKGLTGLASSQDNIHLFKSNKCYALSGLLAGGQYRVRVLISEDVGCLNHNSLSAAKGRFLFMSDGGLYAVAGGNDPKELSDANQPLFYSDDWELEKSISAFDSKFEKVFMFVKNKDATKNIIIVWSYYFDQWFVYGGIKMTGPMQFYNGRLYVADGKYLKVMTENTWRDWVSPGIYNNVYFNYSTAWWHLGDPSIRKKFVNLVLFSVLRLRDFAPLPFAVVASEPPNFSLDVRTQIDWIPTKDHDNFNVPFSIDKRVDDHKLSITQSKSLRFIFENNRNEPVLLTGYEFEWESTQMKPKGLR